MGEKKDRGRFTIKFNEHDPAHESVIHILERQGPRQKAQFIANAILHYIHCPETPDLSRMPLQIMDREKIKAVVMDILYEQESKKHGGEGIKIKTEGAATQELKGFEKAASDLKTETKGQSIDDDMMELIASTMSAFRDY